MREQELLEATCVIQATLIHDAASVLTMAGQWLDPVYAICPEGDWEGYFEDRYEDHFWLAQNICRQLFPDIYADMNMAIWDGQSEVETNREICAAINERVPGEVFDYDNLWFAIDNEWYGLDEENLENYRGSEFLPVLGFKSNHEATVFDEGHLGRHLADGYEESCPEISRMVEWLLGISGNDLINYSYFEAQEMFTDYPRWENSDLSFAWIIQNEANDHMEQALKGHDLTQASDEAFVDFCEAIFVSANLALGEFYHDHDRDSVRATFRRPGTPARDAGQTPNDGVEILHLRHRHDPQHPAGEHRENRIA